MYGGLITRTHQYALLNGTIPEPIRSPLPQNWGTSSIHVKLSTLLQAASLRRYAGRCSLRLWRQSTFAYCSQGVPQIFTAAVYKAHYAVIFAIAQLSC